MKLFTNSFFFCFIALLFLNSCQKSKPSLPKAPIVSAGTSQSIQLPTNSTTLTGSADTNSNKIVSYLWTEISGPSNAVIVSQNSSATIVKDLITGVYTFQFTATNDKGLTGLDTVTVTVTPSPIMTVNLQPANNLTEVHIWGNSSGLDQTNPNSTELDAAAWTYSGQNIGIRAVLKFDLSTIPSNATISSAKLSLFSNPTPLNGDHVNPNYGTNNGMLIQKITTSWDPTAVNWMNQPSTTNTDEVLIPSTTLPSLDLVDIDVTKLVSSMVNTNTNFGFLIRLQNEVVYNSRVFCSSKYSDPTKYPKLVVIYQVK